MMSGHKAMRTCLCAGVLLFSVSVALCQLTDNTKVAPVTVTAQAQISATLGRDQQAYQVVARPAGFGMENPRHKLSAEFTRAGVRFGIGSDTWSLKLASYGRGEKLRDATPAAPRASANRVEYQRDLLTEWYANGPLGLEQGFTLPRAAGNTRSEPLTLTFALSGDLSAEIGPSRRDVILKRSDGSSALRYSGLSARDATGRELQAWLEVTEQRMVLRVADADAHYPLTVDPIVQEAELTASDSVAQQFGWSIAVSGSTIVVGTPSTTNFPQGVAYVFVEPAAGWSGSLNETAKLTSSDGASGDFFGISLSINGDTVVVGAPNAGGQNGGAGQGEAYVFVKPAGGWTGTMHENAKLSASDAPVGFFLGFGGSVAASLDTIVVGAPGALVGQNSAQGAAYVFVMPGAGWSGSLSQNAKLTASDGAAGDDLGASVAISGGVVVAGASDSNSTKGAAYVFVNPGTWAGSLQQSAKLTASDGSVNDLFGNSVAVSGDTVVVGAFLATYPGPGAAYVFAKPAAGWGGSLTQSARLTASDGVTFDEFGWSVAVSGNTIAVGAPFATVGANAAQGAGYMFLEPVGGWSGPRSETSKLVASDGTANNEFGFAAAVDGCTIAVGAPSLSANVGSAYVFPSCAPVTFASLNAKLAIFAGPPPSFNLSTSLTLGANSNGISPLTEAVTLQVGPYQVTIPPGSFQLIKNGSKKGSYSFSGIIGGVTLSVQIAPPAVTGDGWSLKASGTPVNLTAVSNPVTVTITIGDDTGTTSVTASFH